MCPMQSSGSGSVGSVCFWASRIRIRIREPQERIWLRNQLQILPPSCKIVRKTLISTVLWLLYDFLPVFRIRIRVRMFLVLPDPHSNPYQNVTDPQHWLCRMQSSGSESGGVVMLLIQTREGSKISSPTGSGSTPLLFPRFFNLDKPRCNFKKNDLNFETKCPPFKISWLAGSAILN